MNEAVALVDVLVDVLERSIQDAISVNNVTINRVQEHAEKMNSFVVHWTWETEEDEYHYVSTVSISDIQLKS